TLGSPGVAALQAVAEHGFWALWDERTSAGFAAHPYWRAQYFQVGPYRPVKFEPQQEIVLEAVPHYFLGRPKIDTIVLKQYADARVRSEERRVGKECRSRLSADH